MTILHYMTQRDQPPGSRRKACEVCGVMLVKPFDAKMTPLAPWTDDWNYYASSPEACKKLEDVMQ